MRPIMVCLLLLLPCIQAAAAPPVPAAEPIIPILVLTLSPEVQNVSVSLDTNATARFNGTATVDKLPLVRCVVTLAASTDTSWPTELNPSALVFGASGSQPFTVNVHVPGGIPSVRANLTVQGRAAANGLQSITEVTAVIDVKGAAAQNATGQNGTQANVTRAGGSSPGGPSGNLTMPILGVVLAAVSVAAYVVHRRKRNQPRSSEA